MRNSHTEKSVTGDSGIRQVCTNSGRFDSDVSPAILAEINDRLEDQTKFAAKHVDKLTIVVTSIGTLVPRGCYWFYGLGFGCDRDGLLAMSRVLNGTVK